MLAELRLVNPQGLLGDEDFQLLEFAEEKLFELRDEPGAPPTAEVQHGEDDNLIVVKARLALPNAAEGKVALLSSQSLEAGDQPAFHGIEHLGRKGDTGIVCQRKIEIVSARGSTHDSD
jgi:hypothetical protein